MTFMQYTLGKQWQIKIKQLESEHYTFWKSYIQGAPWRKQYRCSFRGALKISKNNDF